jgi:hypothetical protein
MLLRRVDTAPGVNMVTAHRDGIDNQVLSDEFVTSGDVLVPGSTRAAAATTLLPRRVTTYTRKEQII